jgi:hypothetical protein
MNENPRPIMPKDIRHPPTTSAAPGRPRPVPGLSAGQSSPGEVARYIAEFSAELSFLAREAELELLAYLLDMARLEAVEVARQEGGAA